MGIKRLNFYLKEVFQQKKLNYLANQKIGVDISGWICQLIYSYDMDLLESKIAVIRKMEYKIQQLIKNNINFFIVFDGFKMESKIQAHQQREDKISTYSSKLQSVQSREKNCQEDSMEEHNELFYKIHSQKISKSVYYIFMDYCKDKKYPFIVAPFEADSQLIYMYENNMVDYIYSEDSDIVARGCDCVVKGMRLDGTILVMDKKIIKDYLKTNAKLSLKNNNKNHINIQEQIKYFFQLSKQDWLLLCLMCGSDYLDNIKGVGFVIAINFFDNDYNELGKLEEYFQRKLQLKKSTFDLLPLGVDSFKEYVNKIQQIQKDLQEQYVFDVKRFSLKNLNQNKKQKKIKKEDLSNCKGNVELFQKVNKREFALGNFDIEKMSTWNLKDSMYQELVQIFKKKVKRINSINNLCSFENENIQESFL